MGELAAASSAVQTDNIRFKQSGTGRVFGSARVQVFDEQAVNRIRQVLRR